MRSPVVCAGALIVLLAGFTLAPMFHLHEMESVGHAHAGAIHSHLPMPASDAPANSIEETHRDELERPVDVIIAAAPTPQLFVAALSAADSLTVQTPVLDGIDATQPVRSHSPPLLDRSNPRSPPA